MSSVPSARYQAANVTIRQMAQKRADTRYGSPSTTCMTSAAIVPNTATMDTAVQYGQVRYCQPIASANTTKPRITPRYLFTSRTTKSDSASPIAVVSSFTAQKYGPTAGTFGTPGTLRAPGAVRAPRPSRRPGFGRRCRAAMTERVPYRAGRGGRWPAGLGGRWPAGLGGRSRRSGQSPDPGRAIEAGPFPAAVPRARPSQALAEPVQDQPGPHDPVPGRPAAAELVILGGEPDHHRLAAQQPKRDEQLLRLGGRAAQVVIGVQDQQRRGHVPDVADRRVPRVGVRGRQVIAPDVAADEPGDVGAVLHRGQVVAGPLRAGRLEPRGVPDRPRCQVPAVGAAEDAEPVRVDPADPLAGGVHAGHHVLEVDPAPPAARIAVALRPAHRAAPRLAVPGAAPRVAVQDAEPGGRLELEIVAEPVAVLRERAAVDVQQRRVPLARARQGRRDRPALHLAAVGGARQEPLRGSEGDRVPERARQAGERALPPGDARAVPAEARGVQLAGAGRRGGDERE